RWFFQDLFRVVIENAASKQQAGVLQFNRSGFVGLSVGKIIRFLQCFAHSIPDGFCAAGVLACCALHGANKSGKPSEVRDVTTRLWLYYDIGKWKTKRPFIPSLLDGLLLGASQDDNAAVGLFFQEGSRGINRGV